VGGIKSAAPSCTTPYITSPDLNASTVKLDFAACTNKITSGDDAGQCDSDLDGIPDYKERQDGTNPFDKKTSLNIDIDDGTLDGNQLVVIGTASNSTDSNGDGIAENPSANEVFALSKTDYNNEDADVNGTAGDGSIDMSDFRSLRDWLYLAETAEDYDPYFVGSVGQPKKRTDVGSKAVNNVDYNRSGDLSFNGRIAYSGFASGTTLEAFDIKMYYDGITAYSLPVPYGSASIPQLTDFEIFYNTLRQNSSLWTDQNYQIQDLPYMLDSGDIEVWPRDWFTKFDGSSSGYNIQCVKSSGYTYAVVRRRSGPLPEVVYRRGKTENDSDFWRHVYTVPTGDITLVVQGYDNRDCAGEALFQQVRYVTVVPGGDVFWDPPALDARLSVNGIELDRDFSKNGVIGEAGCYFNGRVSADIRGSDIKSAYVYISEYMAATTFDTTGSAGHYILAETPYSSAYGISGGSNLYESVGVSVLAHAGTPGDPSDDYRIEETRSFKFNPLPCVSVSVSEIEFYGKYPYAVTKYKSGGKSYQTYYDWIPVTLQNNGLVDATFTIQTPSWMGGNSRPVTLKPYRDYRQNRSEYRLDTSFGHSCESSAEGEVRVLDVVIPVKCIIY
jgi:hypothetical protein